MSLKLLYDDARVRLGKAVVEADRVYLTSPSEVALSLIHSNF